MMLICGRHADPCTGAFLPTKRTNGVSTSELLQRSASFRSHSAGVVRADELPVPPEQSSRATAKATTTRSCAKSGTPNCALARVASRAARRARHRPSRGATAMHSEVGLRRVGAKCTIGGSLPRLPSGCCAVFALLYRSVMQVAVSLFGLRLSDPVCGSVSKRFVGMRDAHG